MIPTGMPIPGAPPPCVLLFRLGDKYRVRFLDDWLSFGRHWDPQEHKSHPCTGDGCRYCDLPKEWRAFALCTAQKLFCTVKGPQERWVEEAPPRSWVFEFTAPLAKNFEGLSLRGMLVDFLKPLGDKKQKLRRDIIEQQSEKPLPAAFDVRPTLCKIYHDPHLFSEKSEQPQRPDVLSIQRKAQ